MWMMPLHLHVNQKSDYDDMRNVKNHVIICLIYNIQIPMDMFDIFSVTCCQEYCTKLFQTFNFRIPLKSGRKFNFKK